MGQGVDQTALVAQGAALGECEDGCPLRGRQAEDQLDARAAQDRDQLLQVPRQGGPAAHLCRRRGQGQRADFAVGRRGRGHGAFQSSHHPHGHDHDAANGQQQSTAAGERGEDQQCWNGDHDTYGPEQHASSDDHPEHQQPACDHDGHAARLHKDRDLPGANTAAAAPPAADPPAAPPDPLAQHGAHPAGGRRAAADDPVDHGQWDGDGHRGADDGRRRECRPGPPASTPASAPAFAGPGAPALPVERQPDSHCPADRQCPTGCYRVIGYFHHYLHPSQIAQSSRHYTTQTVLSQNADGTVSLIQVDPNNPIITLPDGTTAQVQGVATLHQGEGGATIQTVQSLTDVNGHENMTVDLTETQDGQIYITTEDGQGYPVSVSNVISVPVSMYQSVMANMQQIQTNSDGTVCLAPMQVDTSANRTTPTADSSSASSSLAGNGGVQCYSLISTGSAVLGRRSGAVVGQQVAPGGRYYLATATTSSSTTSSSTSGFGNLNNNNRTLANNNNSIKMPMPMPIVLATPSLAQVASTRSTRRGGISGSGGGAAAGAGVVVVQRRRKPNASLKSRSHLKASESGCSSGNSSSIRCVDSASLTSVQLQLPAIKLEHQE
ncbi:uncharacterized protein LOC108046958 isoform X3 [Drosophila rhopaloa]|uniref:Uncharacterized protein LOC108046958 isoform X4 n=1 Tax=Drosophila rhopaloa TaxID=1041015 RepID=A0A6P4F0A0_DRORH|nr:uncharacterized protein LOC108046958 isoform X3 [Drosophila rhopaloa]